MHVKSNSTTVHVAVQVFSGKQSVEESGLGAHLLLGSVVRSCSILSPRRKNQFHSPDPVGALQELLPST